MKKKKTAQSSAPQQVSYMEAPLLTGQYPAFGIETTGRTADEIRKEKKSRGG